MTAAHELSERGFLVDLYERHDELGGKVRSFAYPDTGTDGRPDLPGSMGGHFFFGTYQNIGETLGRIPTPEGTVRDRLTVGPDGLFATIVWKDVDVNLPIPSARVLATWHLSLKKAVRTVSRLIRMSGHFAPADVPYLACKLLALVTSGDQRQQEQLEHMTFQDYVYSGGLSEQARRIHHMFAVAGIAKANGLSARAASALFGQAAVMVTRGPGTGLRHVLSLIDGPETERWFDPWARYLESLDTRFHLGHTLARLDCEEGRITGAVVIDAGGTEKRIQADWYVVAVPQDKAAQLMSDSMVTADSRLGRLKDIPLVEGCYCQVFLKRKASGLGTLFVNATAPWETGNEVLTKAWRLDLADYGDGTARDCVSFQIADSAWNRDPGYLYGKPARDCTRAELVDEILAHLRTFVPGGAEIFAPEQIHSVHLNPSHDGIDDTVVVHDEPMFATGPGCLAAQPDAVTGIPNLFLAGSYVRSSAGVDSMEAANETGKLAANGVLAAAGSPAPPATVTSYRPPLWLRPLRALDDRRYVKRLPNIFDVLAPTPHSRTELTATPKPSKESKP